MASPAALEPHAIRVLVVDGHCIFAEALACLLDAEPGFSACAATTIEQARRLLAGHRADVMLVDVDLGGYDGIRFASETRSQKPDLRIVVVTALEDESKAVEAVYAGVSGWVPKQEPVGRLISVVRGSLRGETWIPPRLLSGVLAQLRLARRDRTEQETLLTMLTRREKEILCCLAMGKSRDAIADELFLSANTVRTHIQNLLGKLDVHSVLAAVAIARRAGLTSTSDQPR